MLSDKSFFVKRFYVSFLVILWDNAMYLKFERLLKERNVTAYKVGKATGIPSAVFSDWKNGKYTPKQERILCHWMKRNTLWTCYPTTEKSVNKVLIFGQEKRALSVPLNQRMSMFSCQGVLKENIYIYIVSRFTFFPLGKSRVP